MGKTKKAKPMAARAAREMVVQAYWNKDQELKQVQAARSSMHNIALLAVPVGTTAGPATDAQGMPHWLSHGERELVEMDARMVMQILGVEALEYFYVNAATLKTARPTVYARLLKHRSTRRATHSCLTWSDKRPVRKRPRRG